MRFCFLHRDSRCIGFEFRYVFFDIDGFVLLLFVTFAMLFGCFLSVCVCITCGFRVMDSPETGA